MAMEWTYDEISSSGGYAASCVVGDHLLLGYYTSTNTLFKYIWMETGRMHYDFVTSTPGNIEEPGMVVRLLSIQSSNEFGAYGLVKYTALDGTVSYRIMLFGITTGKSDYSIEKLATRNLPGLDCTEETKTNFVVHPASQIHLYYQSTDVNKQVPGVILLGNLETKNDVTLGLLIYGFSTVDTFTKDFSAYSYNPFANYDIDTRKIQILTTGRYLTCGDDVFSSFRCIGSSSATCNPGYYLKNSICSLCHYS